MIKDILAWFFIIVMWGVIAIMLLTAFVTLIGGFILHNPILTCVLITIIVLVTGGSWGMHHLGFIPDQRPESEDTW